jgi:hypothetical protein
MRVLPLGAWTFCRSRSGVHKEVQRQGIGSGLVGGVVGGGVVGGGVVGGGVVGGGVVGGDGAAVVGLAAGAPCTYRGTGPKTQPAAAWS